MSILVGEWPKTEGGVTFERIWRNSQMAANAS